MIGGVRLLLERVNAGVVLGESVCCELHLDGGSSHSSVLGVESGSNQPAQFCIPVQLSLPTIKPSFYLSFSLNWSSIRTPDCPLDQDFGLLLRLAAIQISIGE